MISVEDSDHHGAFFHPFSAPPSVFWQQMKNCMLHLENIETFRMSLKGMDLNTCFNPEGGEHLALLALGAGQYAPLFLHVMLEEGMSLDVAERRGSPVLFRHSAQLHERPDVASVFAEAAPQEEFDVKVIAEAIRSLRWDDACCGIRKCKNVNAGESLLELCLAKMHDEQEESAEALVCLRLLLQHGVIVFDGLVFAVGLPSSVAVVNSFLESAKNLNLDQVGHYGRTALCQACESGLDAHALMLVKAGADPDMPDDTGNSAVFYAAEYCPLAMAEILRLKDLATKEKGFV